MSHPREQARAFSRRFQAARRGRIESGGLLSSLLRTNFKFSPVLGKKWLTLPDRDGAKSPGRAQTESRKHRRPGATVDSVGSELHSLQSTGVRSQILGDGQKLTFPLKRIK